MAKKLTKEDRHYDTLAQVSERIRQCKVSPVEVVAQCLARIESLDPRLNAFITVTSTTAMQEARAAEMEIRSGQWRGPLHGVPLGIKDFYDTAGVRTTAAFDPFKGRVPKTDAVSVRKLRKAGAIILGKTNMHALGMGTTGLDSCFGPVRNPWNPEHIAGGSSSGSAAAVAAGMCYATLDTDAIGSCRLPASCCGVVGFKGTYGLIDLNGILEGEQPPDETIRWLAHAGITARSAEDVAIVFKALADPTNSASYRGEVDRARSLRLGIAANCRAAAEVTGVFEKAIGVVNGLGYQPIDCAAPLTDFSKGTVSIQADRTDVAERAFKDIDVLLLPTIPSPVPSVAASQQNPLALSPAFTIFANYYGLPAITVPCGFDNRGLPLGLQIVGKPFDDDAVLRLAQQYQLATAATARHPPL